MTTLETLNDAVAAFLNRPEQMARSARDELSERGEWTHDPVDIEEIVERFRQFDVLCQSDGIVLLPLHERDSAELTDEYIEYRPNGLVKTYVYYDVEKDSKARLSPDNIGQTPLGWKLRFWTSTHDPPTTPSYYDGESTHISAERLSPLEKSPTAFFRGLTDFVESQRDADRMETRERYASLPLRKVCYEEGGIEEVLFLRTTPTDDYPKVLLFSVPLDDDQQSVDIISKYSIYPNSEVLIGINDEHSKTAESSTPFPVRGTVVYVNSSSLGIIPGYNHSERPEIEQNLTPADTYTIVNLHNPVPYDREETAIRKIRDEPAKRSVLTEGEPLDFRPGFKINFDYGGDLNASQEQAARRALRAQEVFCIHGPPGTGKTRTLRAIIRQAVDDGCTVLACAHSNQAVDNLLMGDSTPEEPDPDSLHSGSIAGEFSMARIGSNSANDIVNNQYGAKSHRGADIVGATTSMAAKFNTGQFDLAVLDEATQATIPASFIPWAAADRFVLAGDHRQLPPYGSQELKQREMHVSLFEFLIDAYDDAVSTMLRTQYRMNEAIATFPDTAFYEGQLGTADQNRTWTIADLPPITGFDVEDDESRTAGKSFRNEREAAIAAREANRLLGCGIEPSNIGIITPYTGQIGTIFNALNERGIQSQAIKIDTIDSFQGGEREAIIVSFVRSNAGNYSGFLAFPEEGKRRLNVALTRARKRLVLIGDWTTLGTVAESRDPEDSCAETYAALERHLTKISAMNTDERGREQSQSGFIFPADN
jgi:hypothetical protein